MAYIDSEMAKRHRHSPLPNNENDEEQQQQQQNQPVSQLSEKSTASGAAAAQAEREPASLGRLHEIDLGQETKQRNIERTEAATRGFGGESQTDPDPEDSKSRRNRKRRTSADIERDRLVEEVLRESKRKYKSTQFSCLSTAGLACPVDLHFFIST